MFARLLDVDLLVFDLEVLEDLGGDFGSEIFAFR